MNAPPDSISSAHLKQLCDMNVPYNGFVDDGFGTVMYVEKMGIDVREYIEFDVLYYKKEVTIKITEVTHTVKRGDSLSAIAENLGITVDDILKDNNIKNPDLIYPGDVLKIKAEINYSYSASGQIDLLALNPPSPYMPREFLSSGGDYSNRYRPISDTEIYDVLFFLNSTTDALASSLKDHARSSTIGNNGKIYWEKPSGRSFRGNQYVETYGLRGIGSTVKKATPWIAVGFELVEIRDGWKEDGETFGHNAKKETVGGIGAIAGATAGAAIGAKAGAIIGACFGGVGAIPGTVIGAFIGGLLGGFLGGYAGEAGAEAIYDAVTSPPTIMLSP